MSLIEKKIAFVRKNNGKWIKRGGTLRNQVDRTTSSVAYPLVHSLSSWYWPSGNPGPGTKTVGTIDKIWFEAMMKFYIPGFKFDPMDKVISSRFLRKLYGLELSPSVLWELMPWSWLEDWFMNWGDLFSNLSNQGYDNLVAKYAYVMRYRRRITSISWSGTIITDNGEVRAGPCTSTYVITCKERSNASPWGFGQLDDSDLSIRQWAILAALGISRLP
jgi:hypothetical protein